MHNASHTTFSYDEKSESSAWNEMKELWLGAWPNMLTSLLLSIPGYINIAFIGHLDNKHALAAIAFGELMTGSVGFTVSMGLTHTIDALSAHAFQENRPLLVGLFVQRGALVLLFAYLAVAPLSFFSTWLLEESGMPSRAAKLAGSYTEIAVFALPFFFMSGLLDRTLSAQGKMLPGVVIAFICMCVGAVSSYIFIFNLGYGVQGAAYGALITGITELLCYVTYFTYTKNFRLWWPGVQRQAYSAGPLCRFFASGLPGTISMLLHEGALQILLIVAGYLPLNVIAVGAVQVPPAFRDMF